MTTLESDGAHVPQDVAGALEHQTVLAHEKAEMNALEWLDKNQVAELGP